MKKKCVALLALTLAWALPGAAAGQAESGDFVDEAAVRAVTEGFRAALLAGDGDAALAFLHPDVTIYEGGRAQDYEAYAGGHLAADMRFMAAVPPETVNSEIMISHDLALWEAVHLSKGRYRDRDIDRRGRETMVLRKTDDGWKIHIVHWGGE